MAETQKDECFIVQCQIAYVAEVGEDFRTQYDRREAVCVSSTTAEPKAICRDKCFSGIRCPLGTWRIPRTTPYILHGDEKALAADLPENLRLIPQK